MKKLGDGDIIELSDVQIGDFVNYNPGVWSQEEIDELIDSGISINNSKELPEEDWSFGGFTVGDSKSSNATPYVSSYGYNKDKETGEAISGWRVFDVDEETGQITLISASCPEDFYHSSNAPNPSSIALNIFKSRDWGTYVNTSEKAVKAWALNKDDLDKWYSKYMGVENADTSNSDTFQKVYNTEYESLVDAYAPVYVITQYPRNNNYLYFINPSTMQLEYQCLEAYGIRILVTLDSGVQFTKNPDTKTVVTVRNNKEYTYNVFDIVK